MNFLADKKVNTGRQKELDIAKALAIIFMIFCHVIVFASFSQGQSLLHRFSCFVWE